AADARSDLYALGAMLYEMLAGRPPFLGDDAVAVVSQHLNTPPAPPSWYNPEVSPALEALVLQLLAKVPDERPASAAEVRARLRGAQVLVGRCFEAEAALPYLPFVEAMREYILARPAEALTHELGDGASEIAKLVPEVLQRVTGIEAATKVPPEQERYRLFESVCTFLVSAAKATP